MGKFNTRDTLSAIASNSYYPALNQQGGIELARSRDFDQEGLFENLIREHQYFDSLEASKGLAFQLDRDRFRTSIAKEYAPASHFNNLVSTPKPNHPFGYVFGEVSNLLFEVAMELNIRASMFTGNPMAIVGVDGYREAELANAFGQRVYERRKNTVFKDKLNGQKRRIRQGIARATRLVERSMAGCSLLCCERFDLVCKNASGAMSLQESDQVFQRFLEQLALCKSSPVIAVLWFRDHLSEIGYRYQLALLVDGIAAMSSTFGVAPGIEQIWSSATRHRGIVFQHSFHIDHPTTWGIGILAQTKSLLFDSVTLTLNRDFYLRLGTPPEIEHFGVLKLSSSTKVAARQLECV